MQKIIVGNWKENPGNLEIAKRLIFISEKYQKDFSNTSGFEQVKIVHAVPTIFATELNILALNTKVILQNISEFESGSHTGDISAKQMFSAGIKMSIIGHSETRLSPQNPKGDEDSQVNKKALRLIGDGTGFVLCVGENERTGEYFEFIKNQLVASLKDVPVEEIADNVIAYEPIWAIGKNAKRAATNQEIVEMIGLIKDFIKEKFGVEAHVLYGGSADENNAVEILKLEGVDGLLVGRASSDPEKWERLLKNVGSGLNVGSGDTTNSFNQIQDLHLKVGDKVILRLDFNVPLNDKGEIVNDFRIQESLPTIKMLQDIGVKTIIIAHKEKGDFKIIAEYLKKKLDHFYFLSRELNNGEVLLLDNVRLNEGEKKNDPEFSKQLSTYGDYFINEAFSASHREHASIVGIPKVLGPKKCALGPKFVQEITELSAALAPTHPMLLVVGGAKFDTKLAMLGKFVNLADNIFVGGALAHNFWEQKYNLNLGKSLLDEEVKLDKSILDLVGSKILLPEDVVVESREEKTPNQIANTERIVDFGQVSLQKITALAKDAKTIVWNGPLGYYEGGYEWGTKNLLLTLNNLGVSDPSKTIILGGGDTVTEIDKLNLELKDSGKNPLKFTHVSTGGGAMIDYLSNGTLPGIEAILTQK